MALAPRVLAPKWVVRVVLDEAPASERWSWLLPNKKAKLSVTGTA
jgi:hypothetical protein